LAEVVATLAAERCGQRRARRREVQAARAATVPPVGDSGTHRDSGQERGSDAASSGRLSAKRLAERGARVRRLTKDRQPRLCRVANWAPQTARLPTGNVTPATTAAQARLGRWSFGGLVFCAIAFSLNHDRLAVMHQPTESGGGLGASEEEAGGLHRGCESADSPAPNRGDEALETANEARRRGLSPGKEHGARRQGRKRTSYARS
jgi:hypothetical protein